MPNVIEELSQEDGTLNHGHVYERVNDWKTRIESLYRNIISWLDVYSADLTDTVEMNEELMREYGVPSVRLPVLRFSDGSGQIAKFIPRGLWIIGANGRVDLFAKHGSSIIFDRSDNFSPSIWEITPSLERRESRPLSKETLLQAIR